MADVETLACPEHGEQAVQRRMTDLSARTQHAHLACGCVIEASVLISKGAAVLFDGLLYRVEKLFEATDEDDDGELIHLATIRNTDKAWDVDVRELQYVAKDQLSGMNPQARKKYPFRKWDYVRNPRLNLSGCVVENRAGKTKVEVINTSGVTVQYVWDPAELESAARTQRSPRYEQAWSEEGGYTYPGFNQVSTRHDEPKPKAKPSALSTAGLIQEEVRRLHEKTDTETPITSTERPVAGVKRPLKTSAPGAKKASTVPEDDQTAAPIPKRRGDW